MGNETLINIGRSLLRISSSKEGAVNIISNKNFLEFVKKTTTGSWSGGFAIIANVISQTLLVEIVTADLFQEKIIETIEIVTTDLKKNEATYTGAIRILQSVTSILPLERHATYLKKEVAYRIMQEISAILSKPLKGSEHSKTLILVASLMRSNGHELIISSDSDNQQRKMFCLLCALSASEVRASLAKMVEEVNSIDFAATALKVASCFDIMRIVCFYLITADTLVLSPDEILGVRDQFSAAFGETM